MRDGLGGVHPTLRPAATVHRSARLHTGNTNFRPATFALQRRIMFVHPRIRIAQLDRSLRDCRP